VNGFRDPSVQFELQFRLFEEAPETGNPASVPSPGKGQGEPAPRRPPAPVSAPSAPAGDQAKPAPEPPGQGGEVVSLDRFRKK
jgi:hypothetical protein